LSDLLQKGTERFGGMSGGHDMAAGARIDKEKLDEYLDYLEANVNNIQSDHTPKS
jgi:RecJ-like exonuclease